VAGIACRLAQYFWDRSFWVDEASLVLNIRTKTAGELLGALSYHQAAPPLFLLAERALFRLTGSGELSLRFLPLVAGCASMILFASLARRILNPWAVVAAVAMFAFSDRLIWHATEVKQYGIDVFVSVLLTWLAVGRGDQDTHVVRRFIVLCIAGVAAVWMSYPAVMAFGGLSLAMLPTLLSRSESRLKSLLIYAAGNLPAAISFVMVLRLVMRFQQTQSLGEYWAEDFLPVSHPFAGIGWLWTHLLNLCNYPVEPLGPVLLVCAVVGGIWMARRGQGRGVAMLTMPLVLNLIASAAGRYPFDGKRLTVYLVPAVLLLGAAGTEAIWAWLKQPIGKFAIIPAAALIAVGAGSAAFHLVSPRYRGHVRPVAAFVRAHSSIDDAIFPLQPHEFACYWPAVDPRVSYDIPPANQIHAKRFWLVWSFPNARFRSHLNPLLKWARTFATERVSYDRAGGCAFLFEISGAPDNSVPPDIATHHKMMASDPDSPPD
jgi:hypothetical protein